jgi:hypothetical protein
MATRMHSGSIFSGFSMKNLFFYSMNFTHLFSVHISRRLPFNLKKGLYQTSFFLMIKRLLKCTVFSSLKRLFFENNSIIKRVFLGVGIVSTGDYPVLFQQDKSLSVCQTGHFTGT